MFLFFIINTKSRHKEELGLIRIQNMTPGVCFEGQHICFGFSFNSFEKRIDLILV